MSGIWGNKIKVSIFGESHGKAIGVTIDGLPSGIELDLEFIKNEMRRRAPGRNEFSTKRQEKDAFEILSGVFENKTTGTPLCSIVYNSDKHSKDYSLLKDVMRPSHADYTGKIRYDGFNDYRGGGHFSGRITAPLVFAGAVAKQILQKHNIIIGSHIKSINTVEDEYFNDVDLREETLEELLGSEFPVLNKNIEEKMKNEIVMAKEELDSVGGIIECAILNLSSGKGNPFFDSIESNISHVLFSVPAVKGVEFGKGFDITRMRGSEANDEIYIEEDKIKTYTNNNGGILGGISNGMPIIFRCAIKPTPSIAKEQKTINIKDRENTTLKITGRHDPCIVQRAIPVIEAAAAIAIVQQL